MAQGNSEAELTRANFRRCILCTWLNYTGLGFNLENSTTPPHLIRTVESNSPAAAAGLKILDLVLAVNGQDVSNADYRTVTQAIKNARDTQNRIDLLVIEKRFYDIVKSRGVIFDPQYAAVKETPKTMPKEYINFPKYTPRTCEMKTKKNESFGFEIVNGLGDIGAYIQEVHPNTPASQTSLRKCDRIIEIDDKFVDTESSKNIIDKLAKAKQKRAVKLYVIDTNTYKYFQENKIPLRSKDYRKTSFSRQLPQQQQLQQREQDGPYINIKDVSNEEPRSPDMESSGPFFPRTMNTTDLTTSADNIRLYTITRATSTESYGIELNYHRRDQYHSLKFQPHRENVLGRLEADNHLIEVNGENIENKDDSAVHQCIRSTKFPQPLQLLVVDKATYNRYKQQGKRIHNGLSTVKRIPEELTTNRHEIDSIIDATPTQRSPTITSTSIIARAEVPATRVSDSVNSSPIEPIVQNNDSRAHIRRYELRHLPNVSGYGFSVNSNPVGPIWHKINQIAPNSPAEKQGLQSGDYIISVNGQNVEKMPGGQFKLFLRTTAAATAADRETPLVLEVMNEKYYEPLNSASDYSRRPTTRSPTINSEQRNTQIDSINRINSRIDIQSSPQPSSITNEIIARSPTLNQRASISSRTNTRPPTIVKPDTRTSTHDSQNYVPYDTTFYPSKSSEPTSRTQTVTQSDMTTSKKKPSIHESPIYVRDGTRSFSSQGPQSTTSRIQTITKPEITTPQRTPSNYDRQTPVHDDNTPYSKASRSNVSPYENERPITTPKATNGLYSAVYQQNSPSEQRSRELSPSSLFRSRENLSRGAVDIVSGNRLLRYCRLTTEQNQPFGFEYYPKDNKHFVRNIKRNSPAERAGLNENDRLVEIDYENVENRSREDVIQLIRTATRNGILRLFVSPHDIKVLSQRSSKSMTSLNDSRHYNGSAQSRYQDGSLSSRDRSIPRHYSSQTNRSRPNLSNVPYAYSSEPSAPLARRCVLQYDSSFRGCGFRMMESDKYDTPIVTEVKPNSPAKRSGLTEGDHIIYIDTYNVQNLHTFNHVTNLIQQQFEQNGQVTLVTLTGPAYHVLKRRGGYLDPLFFDYQSRSSEQLNPRFYQLQLSMYDLDFGFTVQYHNYFSIKTIDEPSPAYSAGLRKDDIIIEINGRITKQLSIHQINDIMEMSKREGRLDLLVIDLNGYQYSMKHAIPLNSLLPLVQVFEQQRITPNQRLQHEPVYL